MQLSDLQSARLIAFSEGPIVRSLSSSRHIFVLYFSVLIFLSDAIYLGVGLGFLCRGAVCSVGIGEETKIWGTKIWLFDLDVRV